jgi:signal transduction histidine kinase
MRSVDDRPRELLIRTEQDDSDQVRLSVKDAGIGFEPQAMDRLFDAFYTLKNMVWESDCRSVARLLTVIMAASG